jgi:hypothetical protein
MIDEEISGRSEAKSSGPDDSLASDSKAGRDEKVRSYSDRSRSSSDPFIHPSGISVGDAKSPRSDSKDILSSDFEVEVEGDEVEGEAGPAIAAVAPEDDTSPEYQCASLTENNNFLDPTTASPSVKCYLKRQFSTTSTVFASETILFPNLRQVVFW